MYTHILSKKELTVFGVTLEYRSTVTDYSDFVAWSRSLHLALSRKSYSISFTKYEDR